jgi:polysaccharide deacetylase family protein (PEP-CTERM system associated)
MRLPHLAASADGGSEGESAPAFRLEPAFLFSVDLEDIRCLISGGDRFAERVPANAERFLDFLARHHVRCTFFTVGDVARRYPRLVGRIAAAGHEIACHTSDHVPLDRRDRDSFRRDVVQCVNDLTRAGADRVVGFRAPMGSLTEKTSWAWEILGELGFTYSSSVVAARNPLYGWPGFGPDRASIRGGLWEIPPSLSRLPGLNVPFVGGVYFRVLPFPLIRYLFRRRLLAGEPVVAYLHPYDIDTDQEHYMHPEINSNRFYNWLLYRNRGDVFRRLERLLECGARVVPYAEYVAETLERSVAGQREAHA